MRCDKYRADHVVYHVIVHTDAIRESPKSTCIQTISLPMG